MPRYKPQERHSLLLPVVLSEQIEPGSFAFALQHLVDHELDLSPLDARFRNDEVGASAYDPRVMLKIVLLAYSQGQVIQRFRPRDFAFHDDDTATCPAGATLKSNGSTYRTPRGQHYQLYVAKAEDCQGCALRLQCLKDPKKPRGRQLTRIAPTHKGETHPSERMKRAIDSQRGRQLYSQRIGTVEPVFANLRHNKRLNRLTLRGRAKVNAQWHLYCMVHNIEKLAGSGWRG